ncbi:hypothetical protein HDU96_006229 [Phlyctochytrium bullatum]|nr:hypothetical protein HDU96_006229 [Phlyctochytrium bullatum]
MGVKMVQVGAAVGLVSLQLLLTSVPILACVPPQKLIKRLGGWVATGIGMVGTELVSIFFLLHALAQYGAWRAGAIAILPSLLYRPLTFAVIASNTGAFLYAAASTRNICEAAVNSFRKQLFAKHDKGFRVEEHLRTPSPTSLAFLTQAIFPLWKPWNVTEINDITYISSEELARIGKDQEKYLQLDVVRKDTGYKNRPIFFYIHGGAWAFGDKRKAPAGLTMPVCWHMASSQNWVVINVNYRLFPKANLADMVTDLERALDWTIAHPEIHGGDPNYIVISGGSAGGHLAALLSLRRNKDTKCYVGFYPVTNPLGGEFPPFTNWFRNSVIGSKTLDGLAEPEGWADPLRMVQLTEKKTEIPPSILIQ